jgi:hypothetical protein
MTTGFCELLTTTPLGEGHLYYRKFERQMDRYGSVTIGDGGHMLAAFEHLAGKVGRLSATVLDEVSQPQHVGDWGRGFGVAVLPKGTRVFLGEGTLFFEDDDCFGLFIGVRPFDREHDWMDPRALNNVYIRNVALEFTEARLIGVRYWAEKTPEYESMFALPPTKKEPPLRFRWKFW